MESLKFHSYIEYFPKEGETPYQWRYIHHLPHTYKIEYDPNRPDGPCAMLTCGGNYVHSADNPAILLAFVLGQLEGAW